MLSQNLFNYEKPIDGLEKFNSTDIIFRNKKDGINLSGTLILPKVDYSKIVIIIPGSGRDKRNSHYRLAKELLNKGVAVLRYDDRGVGESKGTYKNAKIEDFSEDLKSASKYLKTNFPKKKIGAIGHSLGGSIVLKASQLLEKDKFDFIVIMSSSIVNGSETSIFQANDEALYQYYQIDNEPKDSTLKYIKHINQIIYKGEDRKSIKNQIIDYIKKIGFEKKPPEQYYREYYIDFIKNNPSELYKDIDVPLFYIIGSKDRRVSSVSNIKKLNELNNKKITILEIENLGHYFTTNEYLYEIDAKASDAILKWISKQN